MNNLRNFPPVTLGIFQSTLLQEERLKLNYIQNGNSYFNPRSYKRSDKQPFLIKRWMSTFQSTLLQEERHHRLILMISARIFQSTLLQEERLQYRSGTVQLFYFNPRSYKRSNCNGAVCTWKDCNFNPRSYKRSDSKNAQYSLCISAIIIAQCLYN